MDRSIYKSHAETLRMVSFRIILALKAGYWDAFADLLLDCSNAFQATRTDDGNHPDLYCSPAPGFERRDSDGNRMVCKLNVGMQGRIDATLLFNTRLFAILLQKANMTRLMWDKQMVVYHHGPHVNSDASLSTILLSLKDAKDMIRDLVLET